MNNITLTGIPRSGTTLTCHLLNKVSNTVALHEPMDVFEFSKLQQPQAICDSIEKFFLDTRQSILTEGKAITKHHNQKVPDNPIASEKKGNELRQSIAERGEIPIEKNLNANFYLIIKHPAAFTALLPHLKKNFACFAVMRNPLSVLASWNSVNLPVNTGHAPAAEGLNAQLAHDLSQREDCLDRQLFLLSWFYEQYATHLPQEAILRYEETVSSQGKSLKKIVPEAKNLSEPLQSKNKNPLYDSDTMQNIAKRLLATPGAYWDFYSKESVETLLKQY
ncbi:MAG: hypothetical protein R3F23_02005 [Verrucomicrobiia bacterium]